MTKHIHKTLEQKKEECIKLLKSTKRDNIDSLINHITEMGYFIAPGSYKHHRFEGGLVSHSLEVYYKAMELRDEKIKEGVLPGSMPIESVIIAALMHDLCKADILRFNHETRGVYAIKKGHGHSRRSVRKVGEAHFHLTEDEKNAILWHMGGKKLCTDSKQRWMFFRDNPLSSIINKADHISIGEAKARHHRKHRQS